MVFGSVLNFLEKAQWTHTKNIAKKENFLLSQNFFLKQILEAFSLAKLNVTEFFKNDKKNIDVLSIMV